MSNSTESAPYEGPKTTGEGTASPDTVDTADASLTPELEMPGATVGNFPHLLIAHLRNLTGVPPESLEQLAYQAFLTTKDQGRQIAAALNGLAAEGIPEYTAVMEEVARQEEYVQARTRKTGGGVIFLNSDPGNSEHAAAIKEATSSKASNAKKLDRVFSGLINALAVRMGVDPQVLSDVSYAEI